MKTILVPTDYSDSANNALDYAIELTKFTKAKLVLLHVYQIPVPTGEIPVMMLSVQELEEDNLRKIKTLEQEVLKKSGGKIQVESIVRSGFVADEILDVINEKMIDLTVMGITGGSKLGEVLIGSNTTSLIKKTQTPVLVIPKDARFKEVKKIALAYNYNEIVNKNAMSKFKIFVKLFGAKVLVLDVEKPVAVPMYENTTGGESLEHSLEGIEHVLFYTSAENITDGINDFVDKHNCDWLAMIPHKHISLSELFHKSNTKRMAFHTNVPLLALHD